MRSVLLLFAMLLSWVGPGHAAAQGEPFSVIVLPDTQYYSLRHPEFFKAQTEWIKMKQKELRIVAVLHEGDMVHNNTEAEWEVAHQAMSTLDGLVPYTVTVGNHDLGENGWSNTRDAKLFNRFFGPERFKKYNWYGGHYGKGNESNYCYFAGGGMKFVVLSLEFGPRDEVLAWADKVVSKHADFRIIVVTHCYMNFDDTRVGKGDKYNPHDYGTKGNDGDEMWEKFVRKHPNIFLVLSGHILGDGLGRLTSKGDHGNQVHQVLANYQGVAREGNGWLRIMKFVPSRNKIEVSTFSPVLDRYNKGEQNQFDLDCRIERSKAKPAAKQPAPKRPKAAPRPVRKLTDEQKAKGLLSGAENYIRAGMDSLARKKLAEIVEKYPNSDAAKTATEKLAALGE